MKDLASCMLDDKKAIQYTKGDGRHREEIHSCDDFAVVTKKSRPKHSGTASFISMPIMCAAG
jgi:hypothetical protein